MGSFTVKQYGTITNTAHAPYLTDDITDTGHYPMRYKLVGKRKSHVLHSLANI